MIPHWARTEEGRILAEVYISNSNEEIRKNEDKLICAAFAIPITAYERLVENEAYQEAYQAVNPLHQRCDFISTLGPQEQVNPSLGLLKLYRVENKWEELNVCLSIIKRKLYPYWTQDDQEKFDAGEELLQFKDFFMSYTNRNADEVNLTYQSVFTAVHRNMAEQDASKNIVAWLVDKRLRVNNLRGFYDLTNIQLADEIRPKVSQGAARSLVLVQILSRASMSVPDEDQVNWCFNEFRWYRSGMASFRRLALERPRKLAFLIAAHCEDGTNPVDKIRPAVLPKDYAEWLSEIEQIRGEALVRKNHDAIGEQLDKLAKLIFQFRRDLHDSVVRGLFVFPA